MSQMSEGIIAWFARNHVAANLLMMVILFAGITTAFTIKKEMFPEMESQRVSINVPYRGGTPIEVEEGVIIRIEEAIQGIDGIKEITSIAQSGSGKVTVEMERGYDMQKFSNEIRTRVDSISTFPAETERPIVSQSLWRWQVLNVNAYGDIDPLSLHRLTYKIRDEIIALPGISQAEIFGARTFEISIEISEDKLREYGLTFDQITRAIRNSSLDLPAGSIKTKAGEVLLRTQGQAYTTRDYEQIVLLNQPDGTRILLGDVATVIDGFDDSFRKIRFDGKPSLDINVFRVGNESAIEISNTVKEYIENVRGTLPDGIEISIWADSSRYLSDRLSLLLFNGLTGLFLVFISLTLFLRLKLALWVCLGIPVSFLGTLWVMPFMNTSINLISLFGFIVVLGIVVDDAIVVAESVYTTYKKEGPGVNTAIKGTHRVAVPVTFGVLTSIAAFIPLANIPGWVGLESREIGLIVTAALFFSLIESKLILPAHLATLKPRKEKKRSVQWLGHFQNFFAEGLQKLIRNVYRPLLLITTAHRYITLSIFIGVLVISLGFIKGGWIRYVPFPSIEGDMIVVNVRFPEGTPESFTEKTALRMEKAALEMHDEYIQKENIHFIQTTWVNIQSAHRILILLELIPSEDRSIRNPEIIRQWRKKIGGIPGATYVSFKGTIGRDRDPINVQLQSSDTAQIEAAAALLKEALTEYEGVFDVSDSSTTGKQEIKLSIKPEAESLGITLASLARQVRQGFFGEQAQRIQRGRDDIRVMVRYPKKERQSIESLKTMRIRTPAGKEIPFSQVAEVSQGTGYSWIRRVDRNRVLNVTADIDKETISQNALYSDIKTRILPEIFRKYPRVSSSLQGEARDQEETNASLKSGSLFAGFLIFALLAIPLKSYIQPLVIMSVIPFGIIGALAGHLLMGFAISRYSLFGMLALAGIVVNDSLVMVDYINQSLRDKVPLLKAVRNAGSARFRAIMLTSLTTFAGLSPLLLEKSVQAQFLIPMATSLAFGVIFATTITLVLVPCLSLIVYDIKALFSTHSPSEIAAREHQKID
ncbi:MAG: efflux RND transporter permease subunit [Opitutaceae bacterium]|nr:efflux RND transporter permease subunit [Opitutaceae bacterium]